jgi:flagellar assembly protein FliH
VVSRNSVLHATTRGDEVTVQLDGVLLTSEHVDDAPAARERTVQAADIVEAARERSAELMREASAQVDTLHQSGRATGFELGYAEGLQTATGDLARALALVQAAAGAAKTIRDQIIESAEGELIELVVEALERVIAVRVDEDRELVLETLRRGLARVGAQRVVSVRVHPGDAPVVRAWLDASGGEGMGWELRPDGGVSIGGCIIDTAAGQVDARLDVQVAQLAAQLRDAVPRAE